MGIALADLLSDEVATWIRRRSSSIECSSGMALMHEGQRPRGLYFVQSGLMRIERVAITGQRQVLTLAGRGDSIGELSMLDDRHHSASAYAMQDSNVTLLARSDVQLALEQFPSFSLAIARAVSDRLLALTDQFLEVTSGTAVSRTASRISQLLPASVTEGSHDIGVRVSQAELAAWAGLSREGTVKALRKLRSQGIITTSRQRIHVSDVARLRDSAEFV